MARKSARKSARKLTNKSQYRMPPIKKENITHIKIPNSLLLSLFIELLPEIPEDIWRKPSSCDNCFLGKFSMKYKNLNLWRCEVVSSKIEIFIKKLSLLVLILMILKKCKMFIKGVNNFLRKLLEL